MVECQQMNFTWCTLLVLIIATYSNYYWIVLLLLKCVWLCAFVWEDARGGREGGGGGRERKERMCLFHWRIKKKKKSVWKYQQFIFNWFEVWFHKPTLNQLIMFMYRLFIVSQVTIYWIFRINTVQSYHDIWRSADVVLNTQMATTLFSRTHTHFSPREVRLFLPHIPLNFSMFDYAQNYPHITRTDTTTCKHCRNLCGSQSEHLLQEMSSRFIG